MIMKTLTETVPLMTSEDYRDRFRAEYFQTEIRSHKLAGLLKAWERGDFSCPPQTARIVLERQLQQMIDYLSTLALRAQFEGISLED